MILRGSKKNREGSTNGEMGRRSVQKERGVGTNNTKDVCLKPQESCYFVFT